MSEVDRSNSILMISSVVKENYYRFDFAWKAEGADQEGSLVIGSKTKKTEVFAVWFDS